MSDHPPISEPAPDNPPDRVAFQLTATAYHEAGHAVMALFLGRPIQKVTVLAGRSQLGDVRLGVCEIQKGRFKASKNVLEDEVLILFAGMVAEARFTGQYCQQGATQDLRAIRRLLDHRAGSESQFERLARRLRDKTEHLLGHEGQAKAVELIAGELVEKRTISGRAVRHLFEHAMKQFS